MLKGWFAKSKSDEKTPETTNELIEKSSVYYIPCDSIRPNAMRSRCDFNEDKLINLAYSIKRYGVIEPITVRKTDENDSYAYELIAGERRLRASKLAGLTSIPCIILDVEQELAAEMSFIENIYSEPLNYFEQAFALQRIKDFNEDDLSFEELGAKLSVSQSDLNKKLWLLELNYNERQILLNNNISEDIAVGIAQISDKIERHSLIESICGEGLSEIEVSERIKHLEYINNSIVDADNLPRDVISVIKSFYSKTDFLNRRRKRAEIKLSRKKDGVLITFCIKI